VAKERDKVANSLWIGKKLLPQNIISIKSFLQNGFDYNLYVYDEVKDIPSGVNVLDGNDILPDSAIWYYGRGFNKGSPSGFSNEFRFTFLYDIGGLWTDTDIVLLKEFNLEQPLIFISQENPDQSIMATTSLIYSKHPKLEIFKDALNEITFRNKERIKHGETGPDLLDYLVKKYQLEEFVLGYNAFCSIGWHEIDKLINGTKLSEEAIGLHLFNARWEADGIDIDNYSTSKSILTELKKKYL